MNKRALRIENLKNIKVYKLTSKEDFSKAARQFRINKYMDSLFNEIKSRI